MKTYLESSEVKLLIDATTNLRDKLLIRLLFHLGCRVSEALALTVQDIDYDHGTVTIKHLKSRLRLFCPEWRSKVERKPYVLPQVWQQGYRNLNRATRTPPAEGAAHRPRDTGHTEGIH